MSNELKACPFCGGEAFETYLYGDCGRNDDYGIECRNEKCNADVGWFSNSEDAIDAWNTRPTPKAQIAAGLRALHKNLLLSKEISAHSNNGDINYIIADSMLDALLAICEEGK